MIETVRFQGTNYLILRAAHGGDNGFNQDGGEQFVVKYGDGSERVVPSDQPEVPPAQPDNGGGQPANDAPSNVDRPFISQTGNTMTSTMGNWDGEPSSYAYQWQQDDVDVAGANASAYTVVPADVGKTMTCVVTATNSAGSTSSTSVGLIAV